jgi:hypothetical protein
MAVVTKLVMFDERLYRGNGSVKNWADKITHTIEAGAIARCPVRTGEMRASISGSAMTIGPRQINCTISVGTDHATYVLHGTGFPGKGDAGFIYSAGRWAAGGPAADSTVMLWKTVTNKRTGTTYRGKVPIRKKGFFMKLPAEHGFAGGWYDEVHGQKPNNFLAAAAKAASRNHRALRGFAFPEIPG